MEPPRYPPLWHDHKTAGRNLLDSFIRPGLICLVALAVIWLAARWAGL